MIAFLPFSLFWSHSSLLTRPRHKVVVLAVFACSCIGATYLVLQDVIKARTWLYKTVAIALILAVFAATGFYFWPTSTISLVARVVLVSSNQLPSFFVIKAQAPKTGLAIAPAPYLINFQVSNPMDTALNIESYAAEASDSKAGPWQNLQPVSLNMNGADIYMLGVPQAIQGQSEPGKPIVAPGLTFDSGTYKLRALRGNRDFGSLLYIRPDLDEVLSKGLPAHSISRGWEAFALDEQVRVAPLKYLRLTLRLDDGNKIVHEEELPRGNKASDHEVDPVTLYFNPSPEYLGGRTRAFWGEINP